MDDPLWLMRAVALLVIVFWVVVLIVSRGKPDDWTWSSESGAKVRSRATIRVAAVLGIAAGIAVIAFSFLLPTLGALE